MYWDKGLKMGKRGNKVPLRPGGCTVHMEHCQKHSCWPKSLVWTGQMQCCFIDFKSDWRCYVPNLATAFRPQLRAHWHCPRLSFLTKKAQISQFLCLHFYSSESRRIFRLCHVCRLWLCHMSAMRSFVLLEISVSAVGCTLECCGIYLQIFPTKSQVCHEPATGIARRINSILKTWNNFLSRQ